MTQCDIRHQIEILKDWFNCKYRLYNEQLTRRIAMGIEFVVTDEERNKTYSTLNELYIEAEKVVEEIHYYENLLKGE